LKTETYTGNKDRGCKKAEDTMNEAVARMLARYERKRVEEKSCSRLLSLACGEVAFLKARRFTEVRRFASSEAVPYSSVAHPVTNEKDFSSRERRRPAGICIYV
jgi:hypothetical protein